MWDRIRFVSLMRVAFSALTMALLLAGCSRSHDAWFANPCPDVVTVRTFYVREVAPDDLRPGELIRDASLAPQAVTQVKDAFQDAAGFSWFIQVGDQAPSLISKEQMPKWLVALPASACIR